MEIEKSDVSPILEDKRNNSPREGTAMEDGKYDKVDVGNEDHSTQDHTGTMDVGEGDSCDSSDEASGADSAQQSTEEHVSQMEYEQVTGISNI